MAATPVSTTSTRSLLELPIELRFKIYNYLFLPSFLSVTPSDYIGIFLSCKAINAEFQLEAVRDVCTTLHSLNASSSDGYAFTDPSIGPGSSLSEARKVVVVVEQRTSPSCQLLPSIDSRSVQLPALGAISDGCRFGHLDGYPRILRIILLFHLIRVTVRFGLKETCPDWHPQKNGFAIPLRDLFLAVPLSPRALRDPNCHQVVVEHESIEPELRFELAMLGEQSSYRKTWTFSQIFIQDGQRVIGNSRLSRASQVLAERGMITNVEWERLEDEDHAVGSIWTKIRQSANMADATSGQVRVRRSWLLATLGRV